MRTAAAGILLDLLFSLFDIETLIDTTVPKHRTVTSSAFFRTNVALNEFPFRITREKHVESITFIINNQNNELYYITVLFD